MFKISDPYRTNTSSLPKFITYHFCDLSTLIDDFFNQLHVSYCFFMLAQNIFVLLLNIRPQFVFFNFAGHQFFKGNVIGTEMIMFFQNYQLCLMLF